jgi:AcrR family transcriptional regulator
MTPNSGQNEAAPSQSEGDMTAAYLLERDLNIARLLVSAISRDSNCDLALCNMLDASARFRYNNSIKRLVDSCEGIEMAPKKTTREDQLLETATRLFRKKGYHSTSMQDLADALGLQKGSLYYYIDSKEDLLRRLVERAISFLVVRIDDIYAADLPPTDKLRWVLENHAVNMMQHLDLVVVYLYEYRNLPPGRLEEVLTVRKHYERMLTRIVEDGVAAGDFRPVNVKLAVLGLLGMVNWTHQWFSPEGPFSPEEIAETLADMALYGLVAPVEG